MLKLAVVDLSAESRNQLFARIGQLISETSRAVEYLPQIDLLPISLQELRYQTELQACIVGPEIIRQNLTELGRIRKLIGAIPLLVYVEQEYLQLSLVEQYARFGADDVISSDTSALDFIRKIVLLCRKPQKKNSGKLVLVDSGKGGVGVTTVTAGLGEALTEFDKRVVLIDFDSDTQDLSRFLQARPFINENLQAILENVKPLTQDCVKECLVNVIDDSAALVCMPPIADHDAFYDSKSNYARKFLNIIEILDAICDVVIIDLSSVRGALLRNLYRVADVVLYVVNNDAATLYSAVDRLHRLRPNLAPDAQICILENSSQKHGLPSNLLRREFLRATQLPENAWLSDSMQFCKFGYRWPGSGGSIYTQGSERIRACLQKLAKQVGLIEDQLGSQIFNLWSRVKLDVNKSRNATTETPSSPSSFLPKSNNNNKQLPAPNHNSVPNAFELPAQIIFAKSSGNVGGYSENLELREEPIVSEVRIEAA